MTPSARTFANGPPRPERELSEAEDGNEQDMRQQLEQPA